MAADYSKYIHSFIYLCLMFCERKTTRPCPLSSETLEFVTRCPKDENEWNRRADQKACWNIKQNCTSSQNFLYHCLVNEYLNTTLEVCGQNNTILGNACGEYNTVGKVIQENNDIQCKSCPAVYKSTEAYKYQECYDFVKGSTSTTTRPLYSLEPISTVQDCKCQQGECTESSTNSFPLSAVLLLIIALVLLCGLIIVLVKYRGHICCPTLRGDNNSRGNSANQDEEHFPTGHGNSANQDEGEIHLLVPTGHSITNNKEHGNSNIQMKETGAENKNREWICVIAIQIGHSHIGYGFSESDDPLNVYTIDAGMKPSPKSIAKLLLKNGECEKYGFEAQDILYNTKKILEDRQHNYFDNLDVFKEDDHLKVRDVKGKVFDAVVIYRLLLRELVKEAYLHLKHKLHKRIDERRICFVFSLPNDTPDPKQLLDSASQEIEGLSKDNVKLIRRAEAVSFLLGDVNIDATVFNINMKNFPLQAGAKHAVLNIGSRGFDVAVLEVTDSDKPGTETTDHYCENWSGESPEERLEDLLKLCFDDEGHRMLKDDFFPEFSMIMVNFEKYKRTLETSSLTIHLPQKLMNCSEIATTTSISRRISKSSIFKEKVKVNSAPLALVIDKEVFENCFQEMKKKIVNSLEQRLGSNKEIRNLCVTGGYANRHCFREAIRNCLKDKTRIIPLEADLAVAKGAAYYR